AHLDIRAVESDALPRFDLTAGAVLAGDADVDAQVFQLDRVLVAVLMNGSPDNDPIHALIPDLHPQAGQNARIHAANAGETDQAVAVEAFDHETDFVHVPGQHDARAIGAIRAGLDGGHITQRVDADVFGMAVDGLQDNLAYGVFLPGNADCFGKFF